MDLRDGDTRKNILFLPKSKEEISMVLTRLRNSLDLAYPLNPIELYTYAKFLQTKTFILGEPTNFKEEIVKEFVGHILSISELSRRYTVRDGDSWKDIDSDNGWKGILENLYAIDRSEGVYFAESLSLSTESFLTRRIEVLDLERENPANCNFFVNHITSLEKTRDVVDDIYNSLINVEK